MTDPHPHTLALVRFFTLAGRLKRLKRQGWVDRGVRDPESVSEHSYRLALMALAVASSDPDIDTDRVVRLALIHDLPEAVTGDVTPFDELLQDPDVDRDALFRQAPRYSERADFDKTEAERAALREMTADLPADLRELITDAWEEYEAGETAEARLVRQLDKLETWLQAVEYRQTQPELVIESFRHGTERDVDLDELRSLMAAIDDLFDSS